MSKKDKTIIGKFKAIDLVKKWSDGVIGFTSAKNMVNAALENNAIEHVQTGEGDHSRWYISIANLRRWYDSKFSPEETQCGQ